jgi:hypothetical protein
MALMMEAVRAMARAMALMMEAVSTSETSVNFYQTTRRSIPKDSHLQTWRSENLKSHTSQIIVFTPKLPQQLRQNTSLSLSTTKRMT